MFNAIKIPEKPKQAKTLPFRFYVSRYKNVTQSMRKSF